MVNDYEQDQNTAKLVMKTFYKLSGRHGVSSNEIVKFLQHRYGNVWRMNTLASKAEQTLKRSSVLGFLEKCGDRYLAATNVARVMRCRRRKRKGCKPRRRHGKRRRRSRCSCKCD